MHKVNVRYADVIAEHKAKRMEDALHRKSYMECWLVGALLVVLVVVWWVF